MRRFAFFALLFGVAGLALSGCLADAAVLANDGPGFLMGLWHGVTAPVAFVISLFQEDVGIYSIANGGGWYDLGFLIGIGVWGGGGGGAACRRRRRNDD